MQVDRISVNEKLKRRRYFDYEHYKGNMYLKLNKFTPHEVIHFLSDLQKNTFDPENHISRWEETPFFKEEVWKFINVDFGYSLSKDGHYIDVGYGSRILEDYSDYTLDGYYLFIYFNTFNYFKNAEKLIDLVKDYLTKNTPSKIGEIKNSYRGFHHNVYLYDFRPDLCKP